MRIDKYLKLTRLIKRRTVAKELLDRGAGELAGGPGGQHGHAGD